jgi:hypothetical protein
MSKKVAITFLTWLLTCLAFFGLCGVGLIHWEKYLVPEDLMSQCDGFRTTFPKIGTKFDAHSLFFSLIHCENRQESRTRLK